jgi:hypothetical protein
LRLERDVARPLHRSKKPAELFLFRFDNCDSLFLQSQRAVNQIAHVLLVGGIPRHHFLSELIPDLTLLHTQLAQLRSKSRIRFLELVELSVGQAQSLLRELGGPLPELLLERGSVARRRRACTLTVSRSGRHEQCERHESGDSIHHLES